ncbi:MAG: hypothetical protein HWE21_12390 [Cytophagia bacterium]|nr:hypothetical protein [Cytophagia bacterium]
MKKLNKSRISAVMALMLAGTILASASTPIKNNPVNDKSDNNKVETELVYDEDYLEEIDAYVDQYLAENLVQFEVVDYVKVYNDNQELLVEGEKGSLSEDQLRLLRQADLLSELNGTAYYQINH